MHLALSEEQQMTRDVARRFFANEFPPRKLREVEERGLAAFMPVYRQMGELGLLGIGMPEDCGGNGDWLDLALFAEEAGRALVPALQVIGVVLAGRALLALGGRNGQEQERVAKLISGEAVLVPAVQEGGDASREPAMSTTAGPAGISGAKRFVQGFEAATELLVAARDASGAVRFHVVAASGVPAREQRLSSNERVHDLEFAATPAPAALPGGWREWLDAVDAAKIVAGAWAVGAARGALDMAVAYAKTREQFGRPIGSFQAVQHRLADAAMALEQASSMVRYAAWLRASGADCGREAAMARLVSGRAVRQVTHAATLTHGGYGFMEEQDITLYCRRAKQLEHLVEGPVIQRELIAADDVADMDRGR
jgi:alkylation response protein AidB-like acyl-CoA dehydrogenase